MQDVKNNPENKTENNPINNIKNNVENNVEKNVEKIGFFKNYIAPILFVVIIPLVLFFVLKKSTTVSSKIWPNIFSVVVLVVFLLWGYLSLRLFPQNFEGPKNVDEYVPKYQGNGFMFWLITLIATILVCLKWKELPRKFTKNFIPILMTFNIFGLLFVAYLYFNGKDDYYGKEEDDVKGYSGLFKFYRGLKFHPRIGGVDVKQWTNCRFGMIYWQVIILIFAFFSYYSGGFNVAMWVTVILQTIYIAKFFWWETGYFNTLDITLDRAGYYICWGCLVFVPAFYTFTCYYLANNPANISNWVGILILLLGVWFIWMNYKVDAEKEMFKADNGCKIWGKPAEYMEVEYEKDGEKKKGKLLTSGWWGKSRHMNYTYEIGLSGCWSAVGYPVGVAPFAYLGYIIALLVHRIYRDEDKCKKKYGEYWKQYCDKVRYRLIPGIY